MNEIYIKRSPIATRVLFIIGLAATCVFGFIFARNLWYASRTIVWPVILAAAFALAWLIGIAWWRHGARWFFRRERQRLYFGFVLSFISLTVLFYAEESWRGRRAWTAAQAEA